MILELDDVHVAEVFEILCGIPFEAATMHDTEPPTERHAGIEQLIKQLIIKAYRNIDDHHPETEPDFGR